MKNIKHTRAFTLTELLIASAIYVFIMASLYSAFHSGVFGYKKLQESLGLYQTAAQILERINLDLRNLLIFSEENTGFSGTKDQLSFLTLLDSFVENHIEQEYAFVSYQKSDRVLTRLCRKGKDSVNQNSDTEPEEMTSQVEEFSLSYGVTVPQSQTMEWKDAWDDSKSLPQAIKIKLTLRNKTQETFEQTIFLP